MDHALIFILNFYLTLTWLQGVAAFVQQSNQAFATFDRRSSVPLVPVAAETSVWEGPRAVSAWGRLYGEPIPSSDYAAYHLDRDALAPPLCRLADRLKIDPSRLGRFACD